MNHCRRCDSDYEKPGTCNCYATTQPVVPLNPGITYIPIPFVPPPQPNTAPAPWTPTIYWQVTC